MNHGNIYTEKQKQTKTHYRYYIMTALSFSK